LEKDTEERGKTRIFLFFLHKDSSFEFLKVKLGLEIHGKLPETIAFAIKIFLKPLGLSWGFVFQ